MLKSQSAFMMEKVVKRKRLFNSFAVTLFFFANGISGKDIVSVSVMEGDSVTLHPDIKINQTDYIKWYFNDTFEMANLTGNQTAICTNDDCKERFRDRLKLNNQTGSLTIMNIRTTDSEYYLLDIFSSSTDGTTIFKVSVYGVSAQVKKNKGESVTLDTGEIKKNNYVMTWYFNDILIAEITGDQSEICADEQCKDRFKNRLQLDHQTGSLTITNTRTTDSGLYTLQIIISDSSFNITRVKRFSVTVIDSGQTKATVERIRVGAGVCACVCAVCALVGAVVGAVVQLFKDDWCRNCRPAAQNDLPDQDIPLENIPLEIQEHESDSD